MTKIEKISYFHCEFNNKYLEINTSDKCEEFDKKLETLKQTIKSNQMYNSEEIKINQCQFGLNKNEPINLFINWDYIDGLSRFVSKCTNSDIIIEQNEPEKKKNYPNGLW